MNDKENPPIIPIKIVPLERIILADGSETGSCLIGGKTKEDVDTFRKALAENGISTEVKKEGMSEEEVRQIIRASKSSGVFGITDWSRCGWDPKGPPPNWVAPENPSKN